MQMKKVLASLLAAAMMLGLAACGGGNSGSSAPAASSGGESSAPASSAPASSAPAASSGTAEASAPADADMSEWEKSANIFATDETDEELYQKALDEGGEVNIYSISSRTPKVKEAFEAKYPGITCTTFDIKTNELLEKVTREYDAGQTVADVIHIKDQDGSLFKEYIDVPNPMLYNYKPADIFAHIDPQYTATATPLYIELTQLFYNTEAYPDGSPITNIWQLTEPEWKGKVTMQNPLDNISWGTWITGFCCDEEAGRLADAYKELYGQDIQLSDGCANAGYEFLKRLHDNDPIYYASSDATAEAVGTRGQTDPPVGFSSSSKIRKNADNDWCLGVVNLYPDTGIPAVNTLYVVEGCAHPAAAKLLIRFMMGGVDGDTSGYAPFNTRGGWPVRDDIPGAEGDMPYSEINVAPYYVEELYANYNIVRDFWQMLG